MESRAVLTIALLGHPVGHSLSPRIHNAAFGALGLPGHFVACDVLPERLETALAGLVALGFRGANVTIPHKEAVLPHLSDLSPAARAIGAVNTLVIDNGRISGHNTDHIGFLESLAPHRESLVGKRAVVLGAGGAARGVVHALQTGLRLAEILVLSRRPSQAQNLIDGVPGARTAPYEDRDEAARQADLVINTTPVGMLPRGAESPVSPAAFRAGQIAYDLIYNPARTTFLEHARREGAEAIGGLPMLVGQAAASFQLWTGREMPRQAVHRALEPVAP